MGCVMLRWFLGIFPFLSVKFQVYWFHGKPIFWGGRAWRKTSLLSCHFLTWSECMRIMCNSIGFVCIYTWPTWLPASFSQRMEDVKWCDSPASSSSVSARSRFSVQKERYSNIFAWDAHVYCKPWFGDCISFDLERNILVTCAFDALGL